MCPLIGITVETILQLQGVDSIQKSIENRKRTRRKRRSRRERRWLQDKKKENTDKSVILSSNGAPVPNENGKIMQTNINSYNIENKFENTNKESNEEEEENTTEPKTANEETALTDKLEQLAMSPEMQVEELEVSRARSDPNLSCIEHADPNESVAPYDVEIPEYLHRGMNSDKKSNQLSESPLNSQSLSTTANNANSGGDHANDR